jgi:hypothetical protein
VALIEGGVDLLIGVNGYRRKGNTADYDTRSMLSAQMVCPRPCTVSPCGIIGNILRVSERYVEGGGSKLGLEGAETPDTPDEPDGSTPVMWCNGLGWRRLRRVGWWFIFLGSHTAYYKQIVCHCGARALHRLLKHGRLSNWACLDNN